MKYAVQTLGSGNLRLAVALPDGEDLNEWIAVNSMSGIAIYRSIESFYSELLSYRKVIIMPGLVSTTLIKI